MDDFLSAGRYIDSDSLQVADFARDAAAGATGDIEGARRLFRAVRDGITYDPYVNFADPAYYRASGVLAARRGFCVGKAALLAAACRAVGIPARVGYADVRNHLSTERMRRTMQTDLFIWHGYTDIWIDGAWRKATPAFNRELVERFGLLPLAFNGVDDSIYHPFDRAGNKHMEYVRYRGSFVDMPLQRIIEDFSRAYPVWLEQGRELKSADFLAEVERENKR